MRRKIEIQGDNPIYEERVATVLNKITRSSKLTPVEKRYLQKLVIHDKTAEWTIPRGLGQPFCSACGWRSYGDLFTPHCPGCGAKMFQEAKE